MRPVVHMIPFVQMFKEKKYPWVQLAGHPGNFLKGSVQVQATLVGSTTRYVCDENLIPFQGTVLKKYNTAEESCYLVLMQDPLCQVAEIL